MFEEGKTYKVYDKGTITIQKRTKRFVTFSGRKLINQDMLFQGREYFQIESGTRGIKYFVVA